MLVVFVGLLNLALVKWSRFLDSATGGQARLKVIWPVLGVTWLFSVLMWLLPLSGLLEIDYHMGWELVCVTGAAPVVYWLLRLQIGIWAKKIDL
tara:strand:+ start:331 stop:612 length:282 start_codon:yes stop_codon:yes gene_type:complete